MGRSSNQKTCKNKGDESHPDIAERVREILNRE